MSAVHNNNSSWTESRILPVSTPKAQETRYHRIAEVRLQQGLSLRSASRQMGVDVRELRRQEKETTDLSLSELYEWQRVLGVPVSELLVEPGRPLSQPIMERAQLVKVMKTVKAITEGCRAPATQRLAETLTNQLVEIMPELAEVGPWHSVGQRRSLNEFGKAAERLMSEEALTREDWD
ncbi:MAG: helix-turn-helix transcriptional regulator [Planctomycetales bacterium]|nr:helix-turn-helix transcriptional regulator [Planctomycetales bacterium]